MNAISTLYSIYEEVKNFRITPCNLKHEQVVSILRPLDKGEEFLDSNAHLFVRKGFCGKEMRKKTINCAHSLAFLTYERLLLSIDSLRCNPEIINSLAEMKDHLFQIYLLDHKKGFLEKRLSVEQETSMVMLLLGELICTHQSLLEQIETKHEYILQTIMQLVKKAS